MLISLDLTEQGTLKILWVFSILSLFVLVVFSLEDNRVIYETPYLFVTIAQHAFKTSKTSQPLQWTLHILYMGVLRGKLHILQHLTHRDPISDNLLP